MKRQSMGKMEGIFATETAEESEKKVSAFLCKSSCFIKIIVFLLVVINISCTKTNTAFYNKILSDFDSSSYYLAFDIKSPLYKGRVIIENKDLYNYLNTTKGFDRAKYQLVMKGKLRYNRALKVADKDLEKWHFIKVKVLTDVIVNANKGVDEFIAHYFNGTVLNYGIPVDEINAVINQLFFWEVPVKKGNVTGELLLGE